MPSHHLSNPKIYVWYMLIAEHLIKDGNAQYKFSDSKIMHKIENGGIELKIWVSNMHAVLSHHSPAIPALCSGWGLGTCPRAAAQLCELEPEVSLIILNDGLWGADLQRAMQQNDIRRGGYLKVESPELIVNPNEPPFPGHWSSRSSSKHTFRNPSQL